MGGMKEILTKARAGEPLNQDQQEAFAAVASAEERSHEDDSPVAFDTKPTNAVRAKWNPVRVVAGSKWNHQISNDNKRERDREIGERTETKGETRSRHKLFIGHDDSNGADHIHCPGSHVGDR